jgi:hypothetical protein
MPRLSKHCLGFFKRISHDPVWDAEEIARLFIQGKKSGIES